MNYALCIEKSDLLETADLLEASGTAPQSYLDTLRLSAFDAYIRGDKSIDLYHLQRTIARELTRGNAAFLGAPLRWNSDTVTRWHGWFRNGITTRPMSDNEKRNIVSALLAADLRPLETRNEPRYKRLLLLHHLDLLTDHSRIEQSHRP